MTAEVLSLALLAGNGSVVFAETRARACACGVCTRHAHRRMRPLNRTPEEFLRRTSFVEGKLWYVRTFRPMNDHQSLKAIKSSGLWSSASFFIIKKLNWFCPSIFEYKFLVAARFRNYLYQEIVMSWQKLLNKPINIDLQGVLLFHV